jgi:hypothetical protein
MNLNYKNYINLRLMPVKRNIITEKYSDLDGLLSNYRVDKIF